MVAEMSYQEPTMDDRIFAVIHPRPHHKSRRASDGPGRIVLTPAFSALSILARSQGTVPLPHLDRVIADKARLMALAAERQSWRLVPVPATRGS